MAPVLPRTKNDKTMPIKRLDFKISTKLKASNQQFDILIKVTLAFCDKNLKHVARVRLRKRSLLVLIYCTASATKIIEYLIAQIEILYVSQTIIAMFCVVL